MVNILKVYSFSNLSLYSGAEESLLYTQIGAKMNQMVWSAAKLIVAILLVRPAPGNGMMSLAGQLGWKHLCVNRPS
jgi:hypothetical protein